MSGPTLDDLISRDPIPVPPLPFTVEEYDGYIYVRRRDGKHYRPYEPMGINPEAYRAKCEWLCDLLNDAHDYGAMEQIRRARANDRAALMAFAGGEAITDLVRTMNIAAE